MATLAPCPFLAAPAYKAQIAERCRSNPTALQQPAFTPFTSHRRQPQRLQHHLARGLGQDAVSGWLDLAALVSSAGGGQKTPFDDLASKIGRDIYADLNGWHLFLRDMRGTGDYKMSQVLAMQVGSTMKEGKFDAREVEELLKKVPVSVGGGKQKLSLHDVLPAAGISDLERILEQYAKDN